MLLLVEPTSAVDAHTEARIAARLRAPPGGPHHRRHHDQPAGARRRRRGRVPAATAASWPPAGTSTCSTRRPRLPRRRHPRVRDRRGRARRGDRMSRPRSRSPTAARSARYAASIARRHPRLLWTALALHGLAAVTALAAPRLLGDLVEAVETGTTTGHVDRIVLVLAGVPGRPDGAHPVRAAPLAVLGETGAGGAPRGLRRQHSRVCPSASSSPPAGRPAHPHRRRRRAARLVGAVGAAGVDDRGRSPRC